MNQLFLVPACDDAAKANIEKSMENKIDIGALCRRSGVSLERVLKKGSIAGTGRVNVWGTRESGIAPWREMNPGDGVMFYINTGKEKLFQYYGTVSAVLESPELSEQIWQSSEFPYMYFCKDVQKISLNSRVLFEHFGYQMNKVQGFMRVAPGKYRAAQPQFNRAEDLAGYLIELDEVYEANGASAPVLWEKRPKRSEERLKTWISRYDQVCRELAQGEIRIETKPPTEAPQKITLPKYSDDTSKNLPSFAQINGVKEKIGEIGEIIIYQIEKKRLQEMGRSDLAERVELVSKKSNRYGYDILSFDASGKERHIEVKSTSKGKNSSFELTFREWEKMQTDEAFLIARVYGLRVEADHVEYDYYFLDRTSIGSLKVQPLVYRVYIE